MIYLDNAATTPIRTEVIEAMTKCFAEGGANPSSIYGAAWHSKMAIDKAREQVAAMIGAKNGREIYFTGGGTESVNWAIKAAVIGKTGHIITTAVEHHAVTHTTEYLQKNGYDVTYLAVDQYGMVSVSDFEAAIRPDTILATIMLANNEVGTTMPIADIGAALKRINLERSEANRILFHTDAITAAGHIPINVEELGVDMLSLSAHKIYGPQGVGALYIRRSLALPPIIHGGGQERGRRAGTENVAGIVGFGLACELAVSELATEYVRLKDLRDYCIKCVLETIPYSQLNGHPTERLPGNINFTFEFIEGEGMLLMLDAKGIAASSGSACTSGSLDPSHVLLAMGLPHEKAHGSLRITLGKYTTKDNLDRFIEVLLPIVERLRSMSPLWHEYKKAGIVTTPL